MDFRKVTRLFLLVCLSGLSACNFSLQQFQNVDLPGQVTATALPTATTRSTTAPPTMASASASAVPHPADALWVANAQDGNLYVINPITNDVVVVIPTGMNPSQVEVGEGAAWALDRVSDQVIRVNLQTYKVEGTIPIPQGETDILAVGEGGVWVGITERDADPILRPGEEYLAEGGVVRINPTSNQVNGYAKGGPVFSMAVESSAVWALTRGKVDTPLEKIDPTSLEVNPIEVAGTADWLWDDSLAGGSDSLWFYSQAFGKLYRSSYAGRLYAEIPIPQNRPKGPASLLVGNSSVWLAAPWGLLLRIDPNTAQVIAQVDVGGPISGLKAAGGAVWAISELNGVVYRINPATNQIAARIPVGKVRLPTPVVTPTPIQRATQPCENGPFSRLVLGKQVYTLKQPALPQRLHKEPGKDKERVGWIQPGEAAMILEGPMCADNWVWWKVETVTGKTTGWAAEGSETEYWLFPSPR
jgi:hypothetical protein